MKKRVCIYARVSTHDGRQNCDNQLRELRIVAERNDWEVVEEYIETVSGAKGRAQRPILDQMMNAAVRKEFELIMSWSVDRLGRSMKDLLDLLDTLKTKKVDLYLHLQNLDTQTAAGKMLFSMCGVFAEFERSLIQERVKAGLARARAAGKQFGRPRIAAEKEKAIQTALTQGATARSIAFNQKVGVATVYRVFKEMKKTLKAQKKKKNRKV